MIDSRWVIQVRFRNSNNSIEMDQFFWKWVCPGIILYSFTLLYIFGKAFVIARKHIYEIGTYCLIYLRFRESSVYIQGRWSCTCSWNSTGWMTFIREKISNSQKEAIQGLWIQIKHSTRGMRLGGASRQTAQTLFRNCELLFVRNETYCHQIF